MEKKRWFVVQSKQHKESVVCGQINRMTNEIEIFFPKIRNHLGVRPLFPSYLFVRTIMANSENYRLLKFTRGVLRVVGTREGEPLSVDDEVIGTIKSRLGADGLIDQRQMFQIGRPVCVQRGPLKDLIGILEKPVAEEGRVQVLFKMLKYPIRAVMKFEDLAMVGA